MPTPLFSTYRQGENRVSSSLLAVFERLGIDLVARVLGHALEQPELELVIYTPQPGKGGKGTPDGEMRGSFRFLFEVKTELDQVKGTSGKAQLGRHLERLTGEHARELVVVLSPDTEPPALLETMGDERLVWTSFEALAQAINDLLHDESEPASEQQRFLLRELLDLFHLDRLLRADDVAVVAARWAYGIWKEFSVYVCQPRRTFRNVTYWGFYQNKRIEPELPRVLARHPEVIFDEESAKGWAKEKGEYDKALAGLITRMLASGDPKAGEERMVVLLEGPDDETLKRRDEPLPHKQPGAWTQGQWYASLDALLQAETTADL